MYPTTSGVSHACPSAPCRSQHSQMTSLKLQNKLFFLKKAEMSQFCQIFAFSIFAQNLSVARASCAKIS